MKIIKTEEIGGMIVNTYDNGVLEKYLTGSRVENPELIETEVQPTNAEILAAVQKSREEIRNAAIDDYTAELVEGGLL